MRHYNQIKQRYYPKGSISNPMVYDSILLQMRDELWEEVREVFPYMRKEAALRNGLATVEGVLRSRGYVGKRGEALTRNYLPGKSDLSSLPAADSTQGDYSPHKASDMALGLTQSERQYLGVGKNKIAYSAVGSP